MEENIQLIDVTPRLARDWLGFNSRNRNIRQRVVLAYAADMAAGDWRWNGESIKFAADGTLLDGQHRLAAVAESEATVPMPVVRRLKGEAQETVDGGAKRKLGDVPKLGRRQAPAALAAILRQVLV